MNGEKYSKSYITFDQITNGGNLEFYMDSIPNIHWGTDDADVPVTSIEDFLITANPYSSRVNRVYRDSVIIDLNSVDGNEVYYTLETWNPEIEKSENIDFIMNNEDELKKYSEPLLINDSKLIKYASYNKKTGYSHVEMSEYISTSQKMKIDLLTKYSPQYTGGGDFALIDNVRGENNFRLGEWQGYYDTDVKVVLDLGEETSISEVHSEFLQDIGSWIWMPKEILIESSNDGINFNECGIIENKIASDNYDSIIQDYVLKKNIDCRYVKITAINFGSIPAWHVGAGNPSWLFVDEIWVE
ncbi:MAG: discoidin domain-containing protein [Saprospiraceae bacterium]